MDEACKTRMNGAFEKDINSAVEFIINRTDGIITFKKINEGQPDIFFICENKLSAPSIDFYGHNSYDTIAEAEIHTNGNNYVSSVIYIYQSNPCIRKKPVITVHEILHLFGLNHPTETPIWKYDIMKDYISEDDSCDHEITKKDLDYLKNIYG